jgi:hypothetical protein
VVGGPGEPSAGSDDGGQLEIGGEGRGGVASRGESGAVGGRFGGDRARFGGGEARIDSRIDDSEVYSAPAEVYLAAEELESRDWPR